MPNIEDRGYPEEQLVDDEPDRESSETENSSDYSILLELEFKARRREYATNPENLTLKPGDPVIIDVDRGEDLGYYLREIMPRQLPYVKIKTVYPLKRLAEQTDLETVESNRLKEKSAFEICEDRIRTRKLEMKLVDVEYQMDGNKITFYFTADHRIDFRELVKDLAAAFRTRIELRQIGVRDEARRISGYGVCGVQLCCSLWLRGFAPISTQMARDQNISLNPTKISGVCGRLMCCLAYEEPSYLSMLAAFPKVGTILKTPRGPAMVRDIKLIKEQVVLLFEGEEREEDTVSLEEYRTFEVFSNEQRDKGRGEKK